MVEWLPIAPARAMVLACSMPDRLAGQLRDRGLSVFLIEAKPTVLQLAEAALQLRKRDPYLPLFVAGPRRLVGRFQREYPALSDRTFDDDAKHRWIAALDPFTNSGQCGGS